MASWRAVPLSNASAVLLRCAVAAIRFMQWRYNHRLINQQATNCLFRAAKGLERRADRLMTRTDRSG